MEKIILRYMDMIGLLTGAFLITGLISRVCNFLLKRIVPKPKNKIVVTFVVTCLSCLFLYKEGGLFLVLYFICSIYWLWYDYQHIPRDRKSAVPNAQNPILDNSELTDEQREKSNTLSTIVVAFSNDCASKLLEEYRKMSDLQLSVKQKSTILVEYAFFFLHLVDRTFISDYYPPNTRNAFMNNMFETTKRRLSFLSDGKNLAINLADLSNDLFRRRSNEYGKCMLAATNEQGHLKNTLFWEFGKIINFIVKNDGDFFLIELASTLATSCTFPYAEIFTPKTI